MLRNIALSVAAFAAVGSSANAAIVINEVYPGGGAGGSSFTRDYIELYNNSASPVILTGYSIQYASAAGNFNVASPIFAFGLGSVIGANDYLTIATGAAGTGGATLNATQVNNTTFSSSGLSGTVGSVRFVDDTGTVVDLVGYGTTLATGTDLQPKVETAAATVPVITASLNRTAFADSGNNSVDFTSGALTPTAGLTSTAVAAAVPEPASLALFGLVGLATLRRRR